MSRSIACVARTPDQFQAAIWLSVLESAGIDAELHGAAMGGVYTGVGQVASISVVVRAEDAAEALELLAAARAGGGPDPVTDPPGPGSSGGA